MSWIDVMTLAEKLTAVVDEKGLNLRAEDLKQFGAVGDAKATLTLAAIEFARRRIKPEGTRIETPADILPLVRHYAEHLGIPLLDHIIFNRTAYFSFLEKGKL